MKGHLIDPNIRLEQESRIQQIFSKRIRERY